MQYDRRDGKTKLSYSSAAFDSPKNAFLQDGNNNRGKWRGITALFKEDDFLKGSDELQNSIVLNFNIPGLVSMNHPDINLNGGSSEFFVLQEKDRVNVSEPGC